jgi:hypothetical protein
MRRRRPSWLVLPLPREVLMGRGPTREPDAPEMLLALVGLRGAEGPALVVRAAARGTFVPAPG